MQRKMKKRAGKALLLTVGILCCVSALGLAEAASFIPYETYAYASDGRAVLMPEAYIPQNVYRADELQTELKTPMDICTDAHGNVYVADTGNDRVLCLGPTFQQRFVLSEFLRDGETDRLSSPEGVCVAEDGDIYVADSRNARLVVFSGEGAYKRVIGRPDTMLVAGKDMETDIAYAPIKVSVDRYGRIFVVAKNVGLGILQYDADGSFAGFVGAQKVSYNVLDYMWKQFMTKMQKERTALFVPTEYSNLVCDEKGYLYAVSSTISVDDTITAIQEKSKDTKTSPVKKFNASGYDILKRNGYYAPFGDLYYDRDIDGNRQVSVLSGIALGPAGTYTTLDSQRGRIFTYSQEGELLFCFGDKGTQLGNNVYPLGIAYKGNDILVVDSNTGGITQYVRTKYGDTIVKALEQYNRYEFDEAAATWNEVLEINPNCDLAYNGVADALLNQKDYRQAMEYYRLSENREKYSEAFKLYRSDLIKQFLPLFLLAFVVLTAAIVLLSKRIAGMNADKYRTTGHPFCAKLSYAFHVPFHPVQGFGALKYEKRGSLRAAVLILFSLFVVSLLQTIASAWLFNEEYAQQVDILQVFFSTVGIFVIFVLSNWGLTTLLDGEGRMSEIATAVGYAVLPMVLLKAVSIPLTYVLVLQESMYLSFLNGLGVVWTVFLLFFGILLTHQYTVSKNIVTLLLTVVGMAVILFILLLLSTTVTKIWQFVVAIAVEITRQ